MTGELILNRGGAWQNVLALHALAAVPALIGYYVVFNYVIERTEGPAINGGLIASGCAVAVAYVLLRLFYRAFRRLLPERQAVCRLRWTLTEDALALGDTILPREDIRMVHCWPNRDALGNTSPGYVVNIETAGKNQVLRTPAGAEAAEAAARLRELVTALGYGGAWPA